MAAPHCPPRNGDNGRPLRLPAGRRAAPVTLALAALLTGAPVTGPAALSVGVADAGVFGARIWQIAAESPTLTEAQRSRALAAEGRLEEAAEAAGQALGLAEREFGRNHAYVAFILDDLAALHLRLNRLDEALAYGERAVAVIERAMPRSVEYAALASNLGSVHAARGEYREAEPLYKTAYGIFEAQLGAEHERTATTARNLAIAYAELSRREEALASFERAAAARRALDGAASVAYARALLDLAGAHLALERVEAARAAAREARDVLRRAGAGPAVLAEPDLILARAAIRDSALGEAEDLLRGVLERLEAGGGAADGATAASVLYNLGFVHFLRGRFVEAEPVYRRALDLYRGAVGPSHPAVARTLHSLALVYHGLNQYDEAERLYERALDVFATNFGANDPSVAATRVEFAAMLTERGEADRGEREARAALAAYERAPAGDWDLRRGYGFSALGFALRKLGRAGEAAAVLERATALIAGVRGERSSDLPPGLIELGEIYTAQGRLDEAETVLLRAVAIREKDGSLTPWGLAKSLSALAQLRLAQGRADEALAAARRATGIVRDRLDVAQGSLSAAAQGEVVGARDLVERHLEIAHALREHSGGDGGLLGEVFEAAQLPHLSATAATLVQTTARLRPDQEELAGLVAERQDGLEQWRALDRLLLDRLAAGTLTAEDERRFREHLERLAATVHAAGEEMRARFPDYADLTNPRPVAAAAVAETLEPDEALLVQVTGDAGTFLFLVRSDGLSYGHSDLTAAELDEAVRSLRAGLTLLPGERFGDLPEFDVGAAHRLYRGLLAPFEAELRAVRHLIVVPDGAMRSLPFAVLLRTEPEAAPGKRDAEGLRALDYVGRYLALSTMPSADSLVGLRRRAGASRASRPFLGFGDPVLGPDLPTEVGGADERDVPRPGGMATRAPTPDLFWSRSLEVDPRAFRLIDPLPETREELLALAAAFDVAEPEAAVRLRAEATETAVRTAVDLRDHRVLAFATHGLLAGEFGGLAEPALVLTPPVEPGPDDDGLLTASEIAGLHLDADWVILSACNTAAGEKPGAEGLSGLARAFFHAGSRALLVTHWYVPSDSATALTVFSARALAEEPKIGRAEALRRAMVRVMDGEHPDGRPHAHFAHPLFWAPFVNVGEGGPGR